MSLTTSLLLHDFYVWDKFIADMDMSDEKKRRCMLVTD